MMPSIESVDLVDCGVIVNFDDGIAAFFAAAFLHDHGIDKGNKLLPDEEVEEES